MQPKPTTIRLTPEEIATLQQLATELKSLAPAGQNAGQPSWRTMIRELAAGELAIKRKR